MNDASAQHRVQHQPRLEDEPLVRGRGRFADDPRAENQSYACFVRSPHAFAHIRAIDISAAAATPGVLAVLTADDLEAAGVGNVCRHPPMTGRNGAQLVIPFRPALAKDRVLHVGQPVAVVIADTLLAAQDAAELVTVDYEELAPVAGLREAIAPGAPQLWADAPNNIAFDWPGPVPDGGSNARAVESIIQTARHVARLSLVNQRLVVASMEPRGATASYDVQSDSYTLRSCSQGAGALRAQVAAVMGLPPDKLRVVTEDVGGAFGMKTPAYPEYPALLAAAKTLGRPVHWMSTRSEAFVTDNQARDAISDIELALDEDGRFLALRVRQLAAVGGFLTSHGAHIATNNFSRCFPGMYDIPKIDVSVRCVFTNTLPIGPYRGAGRPEANYILERIVDEAARISGIDKVELRRCNLIPASAMPYKTPVGTTYDSGDFAPIIDKALALADYDLFDKRRIAAGKRGKLRGIGVSCFLEHSGGNPTESAGLAFLGGEILELGLAVQSTGQGHASSFVRLLADRLGIGVEHIRHRHGDTALDLDGFASVASRSAMTAGSAIVRAIDVMLAKGKTVAAGLLEAAETDIAYRDGRFEVVGTDRGLSLFEVAAKAADMAARGAISESLDTKATVDIPQTFPNGCHIAEVEVDPDTGAVALAAYTAVDDCGTVLDHTIVEGQVQGAVAQGLGQALMENTVYDRDSGQLVSGSFMDYAMPRAEDMPFVVGDVHSVPATTNPLGTKGVGEAGTTAALAAIMNAIIDAIPGDAAAALDMPATPSKVWTACRSAQART